MDWFKNLLGGEKKEEQKTSAPEHSMGHEQEGSSESQGEATSESGGEEERSQQ